VPDVSLLGPGNAPSALGVRSWRGAHLAIRIAAVVTAAAGVAVEVWTVSAGWSWISAVLDLAAGWSLLAAAGWATHVSAGCRMLLGLSAVSWFLATPQIVGGAVGYDAALLGGLWLAPLVTALLGAPAALPGKGAPRAAAVAMWVRALPALAGIGWLTAAAGSFVAAAAILDARRRTAPLPQLAAAGLGGLLCASGISQAVAGRGSAFESLVAVGVAGCGVAVIAFRPVPAATQSGLAGLVVELGQTTDAQSLERRLARAVGDSRLRLLYQLAPGLPYVTASGAPAARPAPGRAVTVMGQSGHVLAALEHDATALADPALRQAVLAVGRLAVLRLMRAAEAAQQSIDLAESRRRLVAAESEERSQFSSDLAGGPDRALGRCLSMLDLVLKSAPPGLAPEITEARAVGQAARDDLARTAAGDIGPMLARDGLAAALADLAAAAGAGMQVQMDQHVDDDVAVVAWFVASEALANALKHAGPARIWLTAATGATGLRLEVTDDGVGGADPGGRGLRGLGERVAACGGALHVLGEAPGGTRVVAEIPLLSARAHGRLPMGGVDPGPMRAVT
jgi:hypothetical protein